jgi:hypothetical protein
MVGEWLGVFRNTGFYHPAPDAGGVTLSLSKRTSGLESWFDGAHQDIGGYLKIPTFTTLPLPPAMRRCLVEIMKMAKLRAFLPKKYRFLPPNTTLF